MVSPQIEYILNRVKSGNSVNIAVIGDTGSGKSYSCLRVAQLADPTFNIDRVCWNVQELLDLIDSDTLLPGSAIILEEASVAGDARRFWSVLNKSLVYLTETMRSSRLIFILNLPSMSGLDSRVRNRIQILVITKSIDQDLRKVNCKWFRYKIDPLTNSEYRRYPILLDGIFTDTRIKMPTLELRKQYEKKKHEFRKQLQADLRLEISAEHAQKQNQRAIDVNAIAAEILANPKEYLKDWQGKTIARAKLIQANYGLGRRRAETVKEVIESKLKQ